MFRWLTAGESHGRALVAICEGVPAGVRVSTEDVAAALARRRAGYGRGARMTFEQDEVELTAGVRHGRTLGGPVAIRIANTEWPKWEMVMSPDPVDIQALDSQARNAPLTRPRPGHADLAGMQKFGHTDARPILERASARETAARVALGEVARCLLSQVLGIEILSHVVAIGQVRIPDEVMPGPDDAAAIDADPVRCFDAETSSAMVAEVDAAKKAGDTLGGVVEVVAFGLPPGLGSFTHWDRRLDARLAGALMSIQAIKGVEVGDGFTTATRRGSVAHDEIEATPQGVARRTNRAGGIEGGMSTGEAIRLRVAMKPISTVPRALDTIDTSTGEPGQGDQPAQRRHCGARGGRGGRGDGGPGARRGRGGEVRRRLGGGDAPQRGGLPQVLGDLMSQQALQTQETQQAQRPLVVLIGPPGAGKSAVGPLLADRLGVEFRDTDADVGAAAGKPVGDIFIENGEETFRELERAAAARALDALRQHGGVLALGSGAVLDAGIQRQLDGLPVVYLSAEFGTVARRIGLDRPRIVVPGNPRGRLRAMLDERAAIYQRLAAVTVPTDDLDPDELAAELEARIVKQ